MRHFKLEQSNADIISHSGLSLIGQAIKNYTTLYRDVDEQIYSSRSRISYLTVNDLKILS